jgi:hypothetical protein
MTRRSKSLRPESCCEQDYHYLSQSEFAGVRGFPNTYRGRTSRSLKEQELGLHCHARLPCGLTLLDLGGLALTANSLCRRLEKHTMCEPEDEIGISR